ncbi:MAG: hypothetical protein HUJ53_02210 [Holdemanella sp.]|nr:hypothetical protein [Holdemanella sp.]
MMDPLYNNHIHFIFTLLLISVIVMHVYLFVYKIMYQIRIRSCWINGINVIISGILYHILIDIEPESKYSQPMQYNTAVQYLIMIGIIFLLLSALNSFYHDGKERSTMIYDKSIKEGFDGIETGLCFYDEKGIPILINKKMNKLYASLMNIDVLDGKNLEDLMDGKLELKTGKWLKEGELSMIQFNDGTIYGFNSLKIGINNSEITQVIASNITDLYELNKRIEMDNHRLDTMNDRLKKYNNDVSNLIEKEEILSAKMNIHNEFGQTLLATSHSLKNKTGNKKELVDLWKKNILLLKNQNEQTKPESLNYLYDAGKAIGLDVVINGELTRWSQRAIRIFNMATKESMTNAIKHAQAKHLYIKISHENCFYTMTFENDGLSCRDGYKEGGGLTSLRNRVEENGGIMDVNTDGMFELRIELPE